MAALVTVQQAITGFQQQYDDTFGEISEALYLQWLNDLNYMLYDDLVAQNKEKYISSQTYSVTTGTSTFSLPSDFKDTLPSNVYDTEERPILKTRYGSELKGFFIQGSNIVFTPSGKVNEDLTLRYIPEISSLTATTDSLVITVEDLEVAIDWIDKKYAQFNLDIIREQNAEQRFIRNLERLKENSQVETQVFIVN
jgi:hypothetical protein